MSGSQNINKLQGARKAKLPDFIAPQLATLVKEPPAGDQWLQELKFDGYRMLCRIDRGKVTFWSRNGKDWTAKVLNVIEAVKSLQITTGFLDGEIVRIGGNRVVTCGPLASDERPAHEHEYRSGELTHDLSPST